MHTNRLCRKGFKILGLGYCVEICRISIFWRGLRPGEAKPGQGMRANNEAGTAAGGHGFCLLNARG